MQRVANSLTGLASEVLSFGLETFLEVAENALIAANRGMIEYLAGLLPHDSPAAKYLRDMLTPGSFVGAAALMGFAQQMGQSAAGNALGILLRPLGYELDSQMHTARMDPAMAIQAFWRGELGPKEMYDQASDLGWAPSVVDIMAKLLRPLLAERDIMALWVRGEIGEGEAKARLERRGYGGPLVDEMRQIMRPLTGSDDLLQLMFRGELSPRQLEDRLRQHAYNPDQVNEFMATAWRLVGAGDIVELYRRGVLKEGPAIERLRKWGYDEDTATEILEVGRPLTGVPQILALYYRGELTPEEFTDRLSQYGYSEDQVEEMEKLSHLIPPPPDLISMAVREAFHPQIVQDYQYLSEYPPEFGEWMEKQGYDREWAEKYWVAHWRLPSLSMAYEMYHRDIIKEGDLERLFATSDIAPFWRPKLLEAAYRPLTRVDVRRMYQLDVLGREAVFKSYEALGYSPENAELMTQFTEKYSGTEDRASTRADILKAYAIGVFSSSEAVEELKVINYSQEWAEFYVSYENYKRSTELLDTEMDIMEDQYVDGMITRSDVFTQLGEWNLPSTQVENYLEMWDIKKRRKVVIPSVGQLERHLKLGVIDEGTYRTLLERRHYESDTVGRFLQEIRLEITQEALEAQEKAIREERRVAEKVEKTEYEEIKAGLDLDIAELKVAIAETMVLVGTLTDYDLADELLKQAEQMQLAIVRLNEDKARAKLEHTQELRGMQ